MSGKAKHAQAVEEEKRRGVCLFVCFKKKLYFSGSQDLEIWVFPTESHAGAIATAQRSGILGRKKG